MWNAVPSFVGTRFRVCICQERKLTSCYTNDERKTSIIYLNFRSLPPNYELSFCTLVFCTFNFPIRSMDKCSLSDFQIDYFKLEYSSMLFKPVNSWNEFTILFIHETLLWPNRNLLFNEHCQGQMRNLMQGVVLHILFNRCHQPLNRYNLGTLLWNLRTFFWSCFLFNSRTAIGGAIIGLLLVFLQFKEIELYWGADFLRLEEEYWFLRLEEEYWFS